MLSLERITALRDQGRRVELAQPGDSDLGPLQLLPGTWKNIPNLIGRGWNMIALPFATQPDSPIDYRLLLNQYNEELKFTVVDKAVPNRGVKRDGGITNTDQFVVTLDYEQVIQQIAAEDQPVSGLAGNPGIAIHHEPGLWLHMTNETDEGSDIGRLGTIPHGDALLALGKGVVSDGAPTIPAINGLPIGITQRSPIPTWRPMNTSTRTPSWACSIRRNPTCCYARRRPPMSCARPRCRSARRWRRPGSSTSPSSQGRRTPPR
jgi:hypothetical protein